MLSLADLIAEESQAGTTPAAVPEPPQSKDELNVGLVRADRPDRPMRPRSGKARNGSPDLGEHRAARPRGHSRRSRAPRPDGRARSRRADHHGLPGPALSVPGAPYWGSVVMGTDRPLRVVRPADHPPVSAGRLDSRLYFKLHTPDQPGSVRVRVLVYHQNVLLQARKLTLPVGQVGTHLSIRTPYTLVRSPTAASARELSPRRLCLYVNQSETGSHHLCFSFPGC